MVTLSTLTIRWANWTVCSGACCPSIVHFNWAHWVGSDLPVYLSDEKLETITEPEDVEIEKKMADYLELARSKSLKTKNQKRKQQLAVFHALIWARWKPKKTSKPRRRKVKVPPGPSSRQLRSSDKSHSEQKEAPATNFKKSNSRAKSTKGRSIAAEKRIHMSSPSMTDCSVRNPNNRSFEMRLLFNGRPVVHWIQNLSISFFTPLPKSDRKMLAAMFESQPKGKEGLPLFVENSARNPNPNLQASATQSIFFQPSPPFAYETMQQFRDPDGCAQFRVIIVEVISPMSHTFVDMGLKGVNSDGCVFAGPLSALLPGPQPTSVERSAPSFASSPFTNASWVIVALEQKILKPRGSMPISGRAKNSYMRAGTPHFVISLEDTIAHGLHSINACQIQATVFNVLHNFITEGSLANAEHRPIQTLLIRIFIYWVHLLTKPDLDQTHAPNIHTQEGLLDLLTLYSYIVLYPALLLEGYPLIAATNSFLGTPAVMPDDRYQEYMVALHHTAFLNKWIDGRICAFGQAVEKQAPAWDRDDQDVRLALRYFRGSHGRLFDPVSVQTG
ncbi:hypothetical protein R3P38DRAFT_2764885 [Favolaschia claudopus]|uniref:Uncharacterized protein n=1 Tax=Favolaschia claudopus TaxID=2862362 RepID=A0AAW0DA23_9AGAR